MKNDEERPLPKTGEGRLGTFGGVFTPSILTILGIILFMRLGYVVGGAGLKRALVIIVLANTISVLTTFSLSAIATNMRVKGGGDYYLISRTLGIPFGGAIGIVLFLAQAVSIAFYCIGFGEALCAMMPEAAFLQPRIVACLAAAILFVLAWMGADFATKFQYGVMCALVASLVSFFIGGISAFDGDTLASNWALSGSGMDFWILFAIFFPAVTGFTQGVSMSGDLKNAGKSLPRGTFLAVGLSVVVYFAAALVFAGGLPAEVMQKDYGSMRRLASLGWLIDAGVIAATLSSAMASFLGAPRILQSLARDRIFPFLLPFAKGSGETENPRRGVLLSAAIAFVAILLGNLNVIAPVVSMFFLISYGLLNYATYFEAKAASPSFRPRFKWFDYRLSGLGSLACLGVMAAIDLSACLIALAIMLAMHQYLKRTAGPARWADSRRDFHFERLRFHLHSLAKEPEHPRNWRPHLLVFSREAARREQLLTFSSWIEGQSGLTTAVRILEGEGPAMVKQCEEAEAALEQDIAGSQLEAFTRVVAAPDLLVGSQLLIQSYGLGPVRANMAILNWPELRPVPERERARGERNYGRKLQAVIRLGCNVVVLDTDKEEWSTLQALPSEKRSIHVWWWDDATSRLMLLLAYLMTRHDEWSDASIKVIAAKGEGTEEEKLEELRTVLEEARIEGSPEVVETLTPDIMVERSGQAALVFLPLRIKSYQPVDPFGDRPDDLFKRLPIVAMVLAADDIPLDAEPEEGESGERAARTDAANDTRKKADHAAQEAVKKKETVEKSIKDLQKAVERDITPEELKEKEKSAKQALDEAKKAARRAAKAKAKSEDAAREAESLDPDLKNDDGEGS